MTFKEYIAADLDAVFFNPDEFAAEMEIEYGGEVFAAPVVVEYAGDDARVYKGINTGVVEGVFRHDMTMYIRAADMPVVPRKDTRITVDGEKFYIQKAVTEGGCFVLSCEQFAE